MNAETLGAQLAAQPGASVRAADHASVGYDLDVALPESSLLAAVGIMGQKAAWVLSQLMEAVLKAPEVNTQPALMALAQTLATEYK